MRNPLIAAMQRVQEVGPTPIPPVAEEYDQDRYRDGTDVDQASYHGPIDAEGYNSGAVPVHLKDKPQLKDPVPVEVMVDNTRAREFTDWRTTNEVASSTARRVIGKQRMRTKVKIRNVGTANVYIGPHNNIGPTNGYRLDPGMSEELTSTEEVWAISDGANCDLLIITHLSVDVETTDQKERKRR